MKIYGRSVNADKELLQLEEVAVHATAEDLREMANFFVAQAALMDDQEKVYQPGHMSEACDYFKGNCKCNVVVGRDHERSVNT